MTRPLPLTHVQNRLIGARARGLPTELHVAQNRRYVRFVLTNPPASEHGQAIQPIRERWRLS
jgi:hypothetical protein